MPQGGLTPLGYFFVLYVLMDGITADAWLHLLARVWPTIAASDDINHNDV
jgi:hypothetical protein